MPTCRKCGEMIKFVKMNTGNIMPCDAKQYSLLPDSASKKHFIVQSQEVEIYEMLRARECDRGVVKGYAPHWASCSAANEFRKKGK